MKKFDFRILFVAFLLVASVSAQMFISEHGTMPRNNPSADHQAIGDTISTPHLQLDIEILKTLIEQGKNHLPTIKSSSNGL
jgi:archaellin